MHHGVEIADAALVTAAVYGARYISDRFLPDKAIDLVDEAASSLRLAQESRPDELEALERAIVTLQIELESLKNESDVFSVERRAAVEAALEEKRRQAGELREVWEQERARIARIKNAKRELEQAKYELEVAQREGQYEKASRLRYATIPELLKQLPSEADEQAQKNSPLPMLHDRVTSDDVARVVAKSTGIPVQSLLKGEKEKLVHVSAFSPRLRLVDATLTFFRLRWRTRCANESLVKITSSKPSATLCGCLARDCNLRTDQSLPSFSWVLPVSERQNCARHLLRSYSTMNNADCTFFPCFR